MSKVQEDVTEFFDSADEVKAKVAAVANLFRASKFSTLFTGAGLSTSAGIPDFRGPCGVWTLKAQGKRAVGADLTKCNPTIGHMKWSGEHLLSELHGNTNLEICEKCGKDYFRDFETRRPGNGVFEHKTGRKCHSEGCGGDLADSIINFGEGLPKKEWDKAETAFKQANVCVVLGSSCKVTPAAHLPQQIGQHGKQGGWPKLVIVNLQRTPLDHLASIKIHARTDEFLALLAQELGIASVPAPTSSPSSSMLQLPTPTEILAAVESEARARNSQHPYASGGSAEGVAVSIAELKVSDSVKVLLRGA